MYLDPTSSTTKIWGKLQNDALLLCISENSRVHRRKCFLQSGARSHYSVIILYSLDQESPNRWTGRGSPVSWPQHSPRLIFCDELLQEVMKTFNTMGVAAKVYR